MDQERSLRVPAPIVVFALSVIALHLTGCELAKGIFKAGFWVGIIAVFAVIGLIGFAVSKLRS